MIYELVLRNFDCSLEFVFSLLLLQPFNFSPVSFACNFQDWECVILREIDFLLKICWSIPCLHPSWKVHTCAKTLCSSPNRSGVNFYVRVWNTQCLQLNGTIYQCSYSTRKKLCSFESTKQRTYSDHRLHVFPWVCFAAWDDSVEQVMVSDMLWYGIYSAVINVFYNSRKQRIIRITSLSNCESFSLRFSLLWVFKRLANEHVRNERLMILFFEPKGRQAGRGCTMLQQQFIV